MIGNDPLLRAFNDLGRSIQLLIDEKCFTSAVMLIYCGIDSLAHLGRDSSKEYGDSADFKRWVNRYFVISGQTQITPDEWWVSRNAVLHTLGGESKAHTNKDTRVLCYMVEGAHPIMHNPSVNETLIVVDILAMQKTFEEGKNKSLMDMFANPTLKPLLEDRVKKLFVATETRNEERLEN